MRVNNVVVGVVVVAALALAGSRICCSVSATVSA